MARPGVPRAASARLLPPTGRRTVGAVPSTARVTGSLFSVADTLTLIVFPWFLMGSFHSLGDLTLKAAYAAVAVAALAAGNDLAEARGAAADAPARRRHLALLAGLMLVTAGVLSVVPAATALVALATSAAALATGYVLGSVRSIPRRSFPFAPRLPAAASLGALDLVAFAAVLACLLLTATGPILVFVLLAAVYGALALFGDLGAAFDTAAAQAPAHPTAPSLPRWVERFTRWGHDVVMGDVGVRRSTVISDAASLAFQVLFALAVYKIVVHMEFTALALGLLIACGAAGEWIASMLRPYLRSDRHAAFGILVGGVWTLGMFAGLAGSAFPPLEFVFWAGAAAGAAFIDMCRARLSELRPADRIAPVSPTLGAPRLIVMVFAGYLVWWISTIISKPHSINLVLTMAGLTVGLAMLWAVLPASVGLHQSRPAAIPARKSGARPSRPGAKHRKRRR